MKDTNRQKPQTSTATIAGKKVTVATSSAAKTTANKVKHQYAKAIKNLKDR